MMIPKSIIVKYSGFDKSGLYYNNTLEFRTERDADLFILDMKKLMFGVQSYTKIITWGKKQGQKMNDEQLDILLEEATDIKILITLG